MGLVMTRDGGRESKKITASTSLHHTMRISHYNLPSADDVGAVEAFCTIYLEGARTCSGQKDHRY